MNTFLPYASFSKSAQVLDNKRLGCQRKETWQVYLSLTKENYGWKIILALGCGEDMN
jgi:hypothetical protein